MTIMSGLGIVLSLVFGGVLLALFAELYYLLWWKKQRINNNRVEDEAQQEEESYNSSHSSREIFYLFCWDKPSSVNPSQTPETPEEEEEEDTNINNPEQDVELGLGARSRDLLLKALGEDGVDDSDILMLHNLVGPPRFLFTIKEETKEDLDSEDGKSRGGRKGSRTKSLSDLIMALENQTPFLSPLASSSPSPCSNLANYTNPLFESELLSRLRSSPPPKFKFLRDAEEKLYRKLMLEAQKSRVSQVEGKDDEDVHCSSQVLPENKPSLHN